MERGCTKRELKGSFGHHPITLQVSTPLITNWKSSHILFWQENKCSLSTAIRRFLCNVDSMKKYDRNVPLQFTINRTASQNYLLRDQSLLIDEKLDKKFELSFLTDFTGKNIDVGMEGT